MNKIVIYTDGSSKGNPGPGGWGAIIFYDESLEEIGDGKENTTNNRMEITAAIEALRKTPEDSEIELYTDSEYLMKGITVWIKNWQQNNWRTKNKKSVLNKDLWEALLAETEKRKVEWKKILGHSGHEFNDRCDEIAQNLAGGKEVTLFSGLKKGYKPFH